MGIWRGGTSAFLFDRPVVHPTSGDRSRVGWCALALCVTAFATQVHSAGLGASGENASLSFVDRGSTLPTEHVYTGEWEYFVGGGVAVFDCNGDARPDFFAAGGEGAARLFANKTASPGEPLLFDLAEIEPMTGVTGAYPIDIDGDGDLDLAVLRVGPNQLLRGDGQCGFTDASREWGFSTDDRWTTAFTATWEPGESLPTLVFGNYVDRSNPDGPFEACDANELYRPDGETYGPPLKLEPGFCALSMLISDWQRQGKPELRISNDRHYYVRDGYEQMWRLSPLEERTKEDGWKRVSIWGMGIASRDIDGNGYPDVMLTSMGDQLMMLNDGAQLENAPYDIGTYAHVPHLGDEGRPSTGWHAEFGDFNNDGRPDLFIAKGNVDQMPSNAINDPNNLLIQQSDGSYREASVEAGVATMDRSRGGALADFDGDGRLDILVLNRRARLELWQNVSDGVGHWVSVDLRQPGGNSRAVGAWIELQSGGQTQIREVTIGGGHAGGRAGPEHFGLGTERSAKLRVIWPDGKVSDWREVEADQVLVIEGAQ